MAAVKSQYINVAVINSVWAAHDMIEKPEENLVAQTQFQQGGNEVATATVEEQSTRAGRKYYRAFIDYCDENQVEKSVANLREWDKRHNYSRIKDLFGDDEAVYEAGLQALYTRFLSNYSLVPLSMNGGKTKVMIGGIRKPFKESGNGYKVEISDLNEEQLASVRAQCKAIARNNAYRLRFFNQTPEMVHELYNEAITEAFEI